MTAEPEKIHYRETMQRAMQTAAEPPRTPVHLPTFTAPEAPTPAALHIARLKAEVAGWKASSRTWEKRYFVISDKLATLQFHHDHKESTK